MATPAAPPTIATLITQLTEALVQAQRPTQSTEQQRQTPESRPIPQRVLLTVEEAAAQLGIRRTKAWELVSAGEIESVRIGRLRRVPTSAVTDYAARLIAQQTNSSF